MSSDILLISRDEFPRDEILTAFRASGGEIAGGWDYQYIRVFGDRIVLDIEEIAHGPTWEFFEAPERARIKTIVGEPRWIFSITYGTEDVGNSAFLALPDLGPVAVDNDCGVTVTFKRARSLALTGPAWLSATSLREA